MFPRETASEPDGLEDTLIVKFHAGEPFFLIFSENYHHEWKAYINRAGESMNWFKAFFWESIAEERHLPANGYANAWYIDPEKLKSGKDFIVTLYFRPQSIFYLGLFISGGILLGCVGYFIGIYFKKRLKRVKG